MMNVEELLIKYQNELKPKDPVKLPNHCLWPPPPIRHSPISNRENYLRICRREKPLFLSVDTDEFMFSPAIIPDSMARALVVENAPMNIESVGGPDMFGVEWVYVPEVEGSMVRPGSPKVPDITHWEDYITFPDIDSWDWEGSSRLNADLMTKEYAMNFWIMNGLFERLISFMDFEGAALALIDEDQQEGVHRLFNRLADLYCDIIDHIVKYYEIDVFYFHDDWGSQRAPFFSPDTCREMIAPYLKRIVDHCHELGLLFNFHSCGRQEALCPVMIECGVDVWCPQPMNDFDLLYETYSEKITIGVVYDAPGPEASHEEIAASVLEFLERYAKKGVSIPVIYTVEPHPDFYDILYVVSREWFLER